MVRRMVQCEKCGYNGPEGEPHDCLIRPDNKIAESCASEILTPIKDCSYQDKLDGCCGHDDNMTPECHHGACPRLSGEILDLLHA